MSNPITFVPLNSAMFDGSGDPDGPALVKKLGNLSRVWAVFFASESGWISQGTHTERVGGGADKGLDASSVPDAALFIETDRGSIYEARSVAKKQTWVFAVGRMQDVLANRPVDLGTNDVGFLFSATDALDYRWNGTAWATLDTVRGGGSLTDVNRLTKVSAAGTLGESAVTDDGTAVTVASRRLGVNITTPVLDQGGGRGYLMVKGPTNVGVVETSQGSADADASQVGAWQISDTNCTTANKRIGQIRVLTMGATATDRGGSITFATKADGGALTDRERLDNAGNHGFGGNLSPAYPVDVTGDVRISGVYRVGANQVVGARGAGLTASAGAGNAAGIGYLQADAATWVTLMNNLRTRVLELESRLQAHGLIT